MCMHYLVEGRLADQIDRILLADHMRCLSEVLVVLLLAVNLAVSLAIGLVGQDLAEVFLMGNYWEASGQLEVHLVTSSDYFRVAVVVHQVQAKRMRTGCLDHLDELLINLLVLERRD